MIISYPITASGIIVLLKTIKKYCKILLVSLGKNNQKTTLMVAISRAWYNGSYTMGVKPIKSLELHYTMIQFLIKEYTPWKTAVDLLNTLTDMFLNMAKHVI